MPPSIGEREFEESATKLLWTRFRGRIGNALFCLVKIRLLVAILIIPGNRHRMDASTFREKADNGFN